MESRPPPPHRLRPGGRVRELPIDDAATWWSVPAGHVSSALANRPLVLLLHGLGGDERDLQWLVPALPPGPLYASLRAPLPVAGSAGFAWFGPRDGAVDTELVDASARGVLSWLDRAQARTRSPGPVGLLGYSQGGLLAVQLLRHAPELFACAVTLSGFLAPGMLAGDTALEQIRPPVLWGRDVADPVIPADDADQLGRFLRRHTALVERRYPGVGHGVGAQEAADVAAFLLEHLDTAAPAGPGG